jgi:hypothetical protein
MNCVYDPVNKAIYVNLDQPVLPRYTVATLPSSPLTNLVVVVTDGQSGSDCSVGGGSTRALCVWTGSAWQGLGGGGGGGTSVYVNGSPVSNPNFNASSPSPDTGYTAATFKVSGSNIITEMLLPATIASASHKWLASYNASTGAFTQTQPASTDLSDYATLNAATATALASTPTQCTSPLFAVGINASGNALCIGSQTANYFYAAPNGSNGNPSFRALVAADIPTLNQNTTGNAATATALASTPTQCTGNNFSTGIAASGNANCAQVAYSQVSGTPTLYYQTVQANGTGQTQRASLNFSPRFALTDSSTNNNTTADLTAAVRYRTCSMVFGADNGVALVNADLGPQKKYCMVPFAATVVEVDIASNTGTSSIIVGVRSCGSYSSGVCTSESVANLLSGALAANTNGYNVCSNTGGTTGLDGGTTCSATLQNTSIAAGNWIEAVSGTADGTTTRLSVDVIYTVN